MMMPKQRMTHIIHSPEEQSRDREEDPDALRPRVVVRDGGGEGDDARVHDGGAERDGLEDRHPRANVLTRSRLWSTIQLTQLPRIHFHLYTTSSRRSLWRRPCVC